MKKYHGRTILQAVDKLRELGFTSVGRQTLRQYEDAGLIKPARKNNKYRIYTDDQIDRLEMILTMRELDFSIHEIQVLFKKWDAVKKLSVMVFKEIRDKESFSEQLEIHTKQIKDEFTAQSDFIQTYIIKKMEEKLTALTNRITHQNNKIKQLENSCKMIDEVLHYKSMTVQP